MAHRSIRDNSTDGIGFGQNCSTVAMLKGMPMEKREGVLICFLVLFLFEREETLITCLILGVFLLFPLWLLCSGYDFGYLIKILTNSNLPEEEVDFFEILRLFFPVIYDVKYLMKSCKNLKVNGLMFSIEFKQYFPVY